MYRPLPLDSFALHEPVPVNIWDAKGVLLLRKGETITSEQHRGVLMLHAPLVLAADWQALSYGYTASLDRMVRGNQSIHRIAELKALSALPAAAVAHEAATSAPEAWAELHATLAALLHQGPQAHQFLERVLRVQSQGEQLWHDQPDNSLLVLVQLLFDTRVSYSATHALLAAGPPS